GISQRRSAALSLAAPIAVVSLVARPVQTQGRKPQPRTAWGDPDLQGVWNFATLTPLERPRELGEKEGLTEKEAAEFEKETLKERLATLSTGDREWWDPGTKVMTGRRTSLIVEPRNGRVPPLTPQARQRADERAAARRGRGADDS